MYEKYGKVKIKGKFVSVLNKALLHVRRIGGVEV
jgi:hypothetical protein